MEHLIETFDDFSETIMHLKQSNRYDEMMKINYLDQLQKIVAQCLVSLVFEVAFDLQWCNGKSKRCEGAYRSDLLIIVAEFEMSCVNEKGEDE